MKTVYGVFGVAAVVAAIAAGFLGMADVMVVSAILAGVLVLAANSDRIAKIRAGAGGFEAETRAVIDEARSTIEELRVIGKIAIQGRVESPPRRRILEHSVARRHRAIFAESRDARRRC